jgi:hypothetical protein
MESIPEDPLKVLERLDCPAKAGWFIWGKQGEPLLRCGGEPKWGSHRLSKEEVGDLLSRCGYSQQHFYNFVNSTKEDCHGKKIDDFLNMYFDSDDEARQVALHHQANCDAIRERNERAMVKYNEDLQAYRDDNSRAEHEAECARLDRLDSEREAKYEEARKTYQHVDGIRRMNYEATAAYNERLHAHGLYLKSWQEIWINFRTEAQSLHGDSCNLYRTYAAAIARAVPDSSEVEDNSTIEELAKVVAAAMRLNDERLRTWMPLRHRLEQLNPSLDGEEYMQRLEVLDGCPAEVLLLTQRLKTIYKKMSRARKKAQRKAEELSNAYKQGSTEFKRFSTESHSTISSKQSTPHDPLSDSMGSIGSMDSSFEQTLLPARDDPIVFRCPAVSSDAKLKPHVLPAAIASPPSDFLE